MAARFQRSRSSARPRAEDPRLDALSHPWDQRTPYLPGRTHGGGVRGHPDLLDPGPRCHRPAATTRSARGQDCAGCTGALASGRPPARYLLPRYRVSPHPARVPGEANDQRTAFKLLKLTPLKGTRITGDAAFTQRDLCEEVDIRAAFSLAFSPLWSKSRAAEDDRAEGHGKGHGPIE